jgi:hypothetical protein
MLVEFSSAVDAVRSAVEVQRAMAECHSACNIDPLSRGIGVQN